MVALQCCFFPVTLHYFPLFQANSLINSLFNYVIFLVSRWVRAGVVVVDITLKLNSSYFLLLAGENGDNGRSGCSGVHREEDDGRDSRR